MSTVESIVALDSDKTFALNELDCLAFTRHKVYPITSLNQALTVMVVDLDALKLTTLGVLSYDYFCDIVWIKVTYLSYGLLVELV